jgi:uncharacterized protein YlaI
VILYQNVCDNCGEQEEINEDSKSFTIQFTTLNAYDEVVERKRHNNRPYHVTFCSAECLGSWMKEHVYAGHVNFNQGNEVNDEPPF